MPGEPPLLSVSTVAYDGYDLDRACESLARLGATHAEPHFPPGRGERAAPAGPAPSRAATVADTLRRHGLRCEAMTMDLDLGATRGPDTALHRLDFARRVGARIVNTLVPSRRRERTFLANMATLARHAEALGLVVGLENPGEAEGEGSLLGTPADASRLLDRIGSPSVGLNHDLGNAATHAPGRDPVAHAIEVLPRCVHVHLKDLRRTPEGWFFTAIGQGDLDCRRLLDTVAARHPDLPLSIELPMRLHRLPDATISRAPYRAPLADVESALDASLRFVRVA